MPNLNTKKVNIEIGFNILQMTQPEPTTNSSNSQLNLTQHCCEPPRHGNSVLSKNALRLLHSGQFSDMEFEIVVPVTASMDINRQPQAPTGALHDGTPMQVHVFRAHRVIVATR